MQLTKHIAVTVKHSLPTLEQVLFVHNILNTARSNQNVVRCLLRMYIAGCWVRVSWCLLLAREKKLIALVFVLIFALVFVFHSNESYCLLQRNNGLGGHVLSANDLHINEPGLRSGISRLELYRDTRRSSETQNRASAGTYHCLERPIDANEWGSKMQQKCCGHDSKHLSRDGHDSKH